MTFFDPSEYIRGLQQLLVSDKKRIAFLCGAGTSLAKKNEDSVTVPAVTELSRLVLEELKKHQNYKRAIESMQNEMIDKPFNIETLLSNIETKISIIGMGELNGLNKEEFEKLSISMKRLIKEHVSVHERMGTENISNLIHADFAQWIVKADRKYPIEVFTTNYDYLFEIGFESIEMPYFDGFVGAYTPFFYSESVGDINYQPNQTKLWKVHGSLGWAVDKNSGRVIRSISSQSDLLIYPSILKYDNSRKQPYVALMDRLTEFIKQPDSVLFVCGYSFADEHINERILTALNAPTSGHVYAFLYDKCGGNEYLLSDECAVARLAQRTGKLTIFGCRSAIIGCQYGKWRLKREPDPNDTIHINLYYDEDAPEDKDDAMGEEKKGDEIWTGHGNLTINDFKNFVRFLKALESN